MYICCHRAGKAKDLYSRSFLLDEKTPRRDGRVARERQDKERERKRKTERSCIGPSSERTVTRVAKGKKRRRGDERRKGRREENAVEDGRRGGAGARLSENGQDK